LRAEPGTELRVVGELRRAVDGPTGNVVLDEEAHPLGLRAGREDRLELPPQPDVATGVLAELLTDIVGEEVFTAQGAAELLEEMAFGGLEEDRAAVRRVVVLVADRFGHPAAGVRHLGASEQFVDAAGVEGDCGVRLRDVEPRPDPGRSGA
jgi:hypothetical protein